MSARLTRIVAVLRRYAADERRLRELIATQRYGGRTPPPYSLPESLEHAAEAVEAAMSCPEPEERLHAVAAIHLAGDSPHRHTVWQLVVDLLGRRMPIVNDETETVRETRGTIADDVVTPAPPQRVRIGSFGDEEQ